MPYKTYHYVPFWSLTKHLICGTNLEMKMWAVWEDEDPNQHEDMPLETVPELAEPENVPPEQEIEINDQQE